MNKNEFLKLLCERMGNMEEVQEIDYPRIEELCFLIQKILLSK